MFLDARYVGRFESRWSDKKDSAISWESWEVSDRDPNWYSIDSSVGSVRLQVVACWQRILPGNIEPAEMSFHYRFGTLVVSDLKPTKWAYFTVQKKTFLSQNFAREPEIFFYSTCYWFFFVIQRKTLTRSCWAISLQQTKSNARNWRKSSAHSQDKINSKTFDQCCSHFVTQLVTGKLICALSCDFSVSLYVERDVSRLNVIFLLMTGIILHFLLYLSHVNALLFLFHK